ncbi:1-deoxy-D-xylulose-5-phosphate synthase [Clostridium paraputrificum]|jgi:1-deoxy-D-xylulose-5-phosphate synthase|uniref:1-deoxy-D-xylulose-5-phosphate synthase n=1 Tax=Clostridium TaxID=1485 RepID=UPI000DCFF1B8|nr:MULTISPECIES: 1-deoxy-D-xylulose-5-phosphate synthase [Clostridium]MDB2075102.1 1-deoxy-D-xylulose-5-phosphate synthase [Clostridium paraputrificum]MDB2078485.1 1-deoxy-D-xylulose-5-phosphate synthase [Clostridium paraputrificum]MDB2084490.1 1-deoxy-D-xylulose-5-phosphate synthase [Clostridium paraputrificum]MDB2099183.1 1-deoxy-D-xylulose-5-phosphate synthase [Clostridium paraputrificum]MDU1032878.1 1-deoxy-D-xylulose-5-phosphate synthase [Clostridium sp.]
MVLNRINEPKDLKHLNKEELGYLASEIREILIRKVSTTGGHFGPNLGMVEATIAMHYVFNSPIDKIVYDVSHQSYTHKILTGRKNAFINPDEYKTVTGYTEPSESEHDFFIVGHTSTSVSLACGLAKARDIKGGKENIIAVIGDGSLSGGEAYEGLNNAAASGKNIIILVNDNDMSIAENYGGLYKNLELLRKSNGNAENNFFKALGFEYHYIDNGNDIESLIDTFSKVKDIDHPVVIHMHTIKGKGYKGAEENKEAFHWVSPFNLETKEPVNKPTSGESYRSITEEFLMKKASEDPKVVAITAGTPSSVSLGNFRNEFKNQFIDVGIAEEHAVALASGIASQGGKPVVGFLSSFIQRTYDQLSQDLAINNNPALIMVYGGGITGGDVTHLGIFDIPLISNIPNIVYLAPTNKEEYIAMMEWGIEQDKYPVAIRVPNINVVSTGISVEPDFYNINTYKKVENGKDIAIIGLGNFYHIGKKVKEKLKSEIGVNATLINPRFISGIDEKLLYELLEEHKLVITLEDGVIEGGFGEKISRFYGDKNIKVLNFGADKEFTNGVSKDELYERYHLTEELIVEDIKKALE